MPRILGIDVGLRNLAVCAVDVEENIHGSTMGCSRRAQRKKPNSDDRRIRVAHAECLGQPCPVRGCRIGRHREHGGVCERPNESRQPLRTILCRQDGLQVLLRQPQVQLTQELVRKMCGEQDEEGGDANSKKRYTQHKKMAVEAVGETWQRSGPSSGSLGAG